MVLEGATSSLAIFFRGTAFGILLVLLLQAILVYNLFLFLVNPRVRLTTPSPGDRGEEAADLVGPSSSLPPPAGTSTGIANDTTTNASTTKVINRSRHTATASTSSTSNGNSNEGPLPGTGDADKDAEHLLPWPEGIKERLRRWLTPSPEDLPVKPIEKPVVTVLGGGGGGVSGAASTSTTTFSEIQETMVVEDFPFQAMTPTQEADWLNLILTRTFVTLRESREFRLIYATKMSNRMNLKLKSSSLGTNSSFAIVSSLDITDLRLGEFPPSIEGIRILKGVSKDYAVMGECDLSYRGGASISIIVTLANGSVIPVQVFMNEFIGTVRIRLPSERWSDMLGFAFTQDPGVTFRVESPLTLWDNQMLRGLVNSLLSTLMRKTFLELWVLPSWRTTFIPMLEPTSAEDWVAREKEDQALDSGIKKAAKSTIASRATQLWESSTIPLGGNLQSLLKKPSEKLKDCLEGVVFDVTCFLPRDKSESIESFETPLVSSFIGFINEPLEVPRARIPSSEILKTGTVSGEGEGVSEDTHFNPSGWKAVRSKLDISIQRKRVMDHDTNSVVEMSRATIPISCDLNRTFAILSNPMHFRHVYDFFLDSKTIFEDGSQMVHSCSFNMSKTERKFQVFQVKSVGEEVEEKFVVMRSIAGFAESDTDLESERSESVGGRQSSVGQDDSDPSILRHRASRASLGTRKSDEAGMAMPSNSPPAFSSSIESNSHTKLATALIPDQDCTVYLFGYYLTKVGENSCLVTAISQFAPELHKLEVDFSFCRKLKHFIEELTHFTDGHHPTSNTEVGLAKKYFGETDEKVRKKLGHLLGHATSFLLKTLPTNNKNLEIANPAIEDTESEGIDALENQASENPLSPLPNGHQSLHGSMEDFAREPYVERVLGAKETIRVEVPFQREKYGASVLFKFEYCCRTEQTPSFGIHYLPANPDALSGIANLLPYAGGGARILFPISHCQSYSRPAVGQISLSDLKSGTLILIWQNDQPLSARLVKSLTYKVIFQGEPTSYPDLHSQIAIPRKSFLSLPFIYDPSVAIEGGMLNIDFSTGNVIVPFALYFEELLPSSDESLSQTSATKSLVSERLANVVTHGAEVNIPIRRSDRKTIIPLNSPHAKSGHNSYPNIPLGKYGVFTLVWDNTASIVSTRQIVFHITLSFRQT